jgi:hypothetical protein
MFQRALGWSCKRNDFSALDAEMSRDFVSAWAGACILQKWL